MHTNIQVAKTDIGVTGQNGVYRPITDLASALTYVPDGVAAVNGDSGGPVFAGVENYPAAEARGMVNALDTTVNRLLGRPAELDAIPRRLPQPPRGWQSRIRSSAQLWSVAVTSEERRVIRRAVRALAVFACLTAAVAGWVAWDRSHIHDTLVPGDVLVSSDGPTLPTPVTWTGREDRPRLEAHEPPSAVTLVLKTEAAR